jgi:alkylation response protein AidB-like acyl-CoA dehydrogenase
MAVGSEELEMLRDTAARIRESATLAALRRLRDSGTSLGHDPQLYGELASLGLTGIVVPEDYGGAGFGYRGLGIVLEELGRALVATPLVSSTVLAANALLLAGNDAQKQAWLPRIADGSLVASLAVDEGAHHAPLAVALTARPADGGWQLDGVKRPVVDGMAAGMVIVVARTAGAPGDAQGLGLFAIESDANGLERTPLRQIDSRGAAVYRFDGVKVPLDAVLGTSNGAADVLDAVLDRGRAALAAEMLGAATQAFDTTVEYLKVREQFGQYIGAFQALQHRAVAMLGELELTRTAVEAALGAIDAGAADVAQLVSMAKVQASDTLRLVSNEMVQMHGGIGMTDEHDAGFYLKYARAAAAAYGSAAFHRERYARLVSL